MAATRNRSTEAGREFWDHVEKIAAEVDARQKKCPAVHRKGHGCPACGWLEK